MARVFTGELDSDATVKEFTGALDPAIPSAAGAKRLGSPSFLDQIAGTVGKLFGNTSVMDELDGVTPAPVSPADAIAATQASNRAISNIMAERNAPGERRREFSRANPKLGALASGSAQVLQNTLDAVPLAADVFNNYAVDPVLSAVGLKPLDQAPRLPGAKQLQDAARDYAPTITGRSLEGAWNNDKMVEWLGANLAQQAPQISQSVGAALIPGSRIPLLLGMGGQAGAGAYQQNKDEGFAKGAAVADALTKGNIEVLSEMLPLGVFDRVKGLVSGLPSPIRGAVMADAAKRVLAGGSALTAQGLTGAIEESVAQLGGNASENVLLGKDTPLLDKVPESAVLGAAAGKVLGLPHVLHATQATGANQEIANAFNEGVANAEYAMPAEQVARASMAPNETQMLKTLQPAVKEFTGELDQPENVNDLPPAADATPAQQSVIPAPAQPATIAADESGAAIAIPNPRAQQQTALTPATPESAIHATSQPVAEMAAEIERPIQLPDQITDQSTQLEVAPEGLRPGDIVAASGKPFATEAEAQKEQRLAGKGWQVKKGAGGFVVRHQPQSEKQISATRNRLRDANRVDTESDSMFAAIAKLGGIRLDDLTKQWGFDPAEFQRLRGSGIKRVGTKNGMSLDRAGEALAELGYLSYDENGKHDLNELFDLFDGELRGSKHFTPQGYAKVGQAMQEQGWLEAQLAEELDNLPEEAQSAIEDLLNEYENTTAETEAELESRLEREGIEYDAAASLDREIVEDSPDTSAEERINRSIDQAFESPSPASATNKRASDIGEGSGRVRSEGVIAAEDKARKERLAIQRRYEQDADKFARDRDLAAVRAELETAQDNDKPFDDVPFSRKAERANGMTVEATRSAIAADTFSHDVDVYATLDEAPQYIQNQARREGGGDVGGFWDMAKNKVALIAENLDSPERARIVARHELIGHYGLENMLRESADPGAMNALVARVIRADKDGNKLIREIGAQVDRSQPDLDEKRRAKEIIATMAERNIQNSITRRVYDAIRSFLKKIGFIDSDITDAKIASLLRAAQEYLRAVGRPMEHGQPAAAFAREDQTPLESGTPLTKAEVLAKQDENARAAKDEGRVEKPKEKNVTVDQVDMFNEQGSLFNRREPVKGMKVDHSQDELPFNPRSAFTVSEPGILDNVTRAMQNNKIDLKRIQEAIRSEGRSISENHDAYLNEELYIGRVTAQIDKFVENRVTPMLEAIDKAGVSLEDVNKFLYARHAPERNAQLKKINPNRIDNDRLSGMSDVKAAGIMSGFRDSGKLEKLQSIASMVDAITKESRRRIVASGLETAEVVQAWEDVYQRYVPLMADMEVQIGKKKGGFTVKGEESQRSLGQLDMAQNILANVVAQAQGTIMRSEKAKVGRSLLDLARAHPNDKFWKVDEPPKKRRINKETGLVEWAEDPMFKTRDNVLVVKENGKEHYLVLEPTNERAMQLAAAMQNLDAAQLPWVIEATGKITRHLAQWITARNPLFWITNFTRDVQGAAFNLQNTPIAGKELQVMGNIPKAMRGYWKITRGDGSGKWADYAQEFKSAGAETGYIKVFDSPDDHMADLEKQLAQMQQGEADPRKLARSLIEGIDDYNTIIENGVRLAVYQTARENGVTIRKAASIAKNITVNFNRRGNQSTGWNALYMFMNASIQGNVRFMSAIATSRRAQIVAGSLVGMGFVLDAVNRAIGGDDDETGWKKYDEIPEWDKERNWIFMAPNGKYIKVPMPYGPHVALNLGRMMSEMIFGREKKVVDRALSMASITVDAFNPLGSNGSFAQLLSPSVLKPVVQVSENKSFNGSSLYRDADERGHIAPAYTRHFRSTPAHWKEASKLLNDITGGDAVKPGAINVPPEVLRSLFLSYVAPGLMQTADKTIDTSTRAANGKKIEPSQIPALSRFYGEAPEERAQERAFYEEQRKVKQAIEQTKKYAKAGDRDGVQRTLTELGEGDLKKGQEIRRKWESSEKALLQLNAQRRRLETDKVDDALQKTQLDRIEKLRLDLMKRAMR